MKKIDWKYKILIIIFSSGILFSLLFFSFKYNVHITSILSDIFYFPINVITPKNREIVLDGLIKEKDLEIDELKELLKFKETLSEFTIISGTIINRNSLYWNNELVINIGDKDGVKVGMAVIDNKGLIGKIVDTSYTTSRVKLITSNDTNNKISVKIWFNDKSINKILSVDEDNNLYISGIDNRENIKVGDLVTTSGLSDIFPSGIDIGYVLKIENDKFGISQKAFIKPASNLDDLRFVFVLKRLS